MFNTFKSRVFGMSALVLAASVLVGVAATQDDHDDAAHANDTIKIASFDPQLVFQQYHGLNELVALSQRLEAEAQQAQIDGNQQRLMELNNEMQQGQMRIVNQFQEDIDRIVPEIAKAHHIDLVALEVVYASDKFSEAQDITTQVIEALNAEAPATDDAEEEPMMQRRTTEPQVSPEFAPE
jgi:Skp family chaperone for outer membrane proteins